MYRAPELEVTAETDGEVFKASHLAVDGQKVGERLRGVVVTAVAGVDDGHERVHGRHQRRALLGMAHGDDVAVAAHSAHVSATLSPLAADELFASEKPSTLPPRESIALSKLRRVRVEGSKKRVARILPSHLCAYSAGMVDDVAGGIHQLHDLLLGELQNVDQAFHISLFLLL